MLSGGETSADKLAPSLIPMSVNDLHVHSLTLVHEPVAIMHPTLRRMAGHNNCILYLQSVSRKLSLTQSPQLSPWTRRW